MRADWKPFSAAMYIAAAQTAGFSASHVAGEKPGHGNLRVYHVGSYLADRSLLRICQRKTELRKEFRQVAVSHCRRGAAPLAVFGKRQSEGENVRLFRREISSCKPDIAQLSGTVYLPVRGICVGKSETLSEFFRQRFGDPPFSIIERARKSRPRLSSASVPPPRDRRERHREGKCLR